VRGQVIGGLFGLAAKGGTCWCDVGWKRNRMSIISQRDDMVRFIDVFPDCQSVDQKHGELHVHGKYGVVVVVAVLNWKDMNRR
jgi:hypothetical protein